MSALPPGPTEPPLVQTMRWLMRPISFLEACRRRYGEAFSITFLGFQTPMVMLSDPEHLQNSDNILAQSSRRTPPSTSGT